MALLRRTKEKAAAAKPTASTARKSDKKAARQTGAGPTRYDRVIRPRVTEKAMLLSEKRVYTFEVFTHASKKAIAEFVHAQYGVEPIAVRVAKKAGKQKFIRGRWGEKAGIKKAFVQLKEGDKIEFA